MECQICMDTFEEEDLLRHCEGKHVFCKRCFDEWRVTTCRSNSRACVCPVCRSEILFQREEVRYFPSGKIVSICGVLGNVLHGSYKIWYENGHLYEDSSYANDQRHGIFRIWYENGVLKEECRYVEGKKEGLSQSWYSNGSVKEVCFYNDGVLHGEYRKWYQGVAYLSLEEFCKYDHGKGHVYRWYKSGKKQQEYFVEDGIWNGPFQAWYESGDPSSKGIYQQGMRIGTWLDWSPDGTQISALYHEGRTIEEIFHSLYEEKEDSYANT